MSSSLAAVPSNSSPHRRKQKPIHYTAAYVPIRTLFVPKIPATVREIDLRKYFHNFGQITKLFTKISRSRQYRYAVITFKRPEQAAMVLNKNRHKMKNGVTLQVRYVASCYQAALADPAEPPKIDYSISQLSIPKDSLLILNDDCLAEIFSYLNLHDQVKLSGLCSRLDAVGQVSIRKIKKVNFTNIGFSTPMEAANIIRKIGKNVEHFYFSGLRFPYSHNSFARFFLPMCTNLRSLELDQVNISETTYKRLEPLFSKLESLVLTNCKITDNDLKHLKNCSDLKKLDISDTAKGFFIWPSRLQYDDIHIHINYVCMYRLRMSLARKEFISGFRNLKVLIVSFSADDDLLKRLTNNNINLTHLSIAGSLRVSETRLLKFIAKSSNIQQIDISYCAQILPTLVIYSIDKLKELQRPHCLELVVGGTAISKEMETVPEYTDYKHLLKISYDSMTSKRYTGYTEFEP